MKKLYQRSSKGAVHPSPPTAVSDHHLAFLPAAILALAAALSADDRHVLAYLISSSNNNFPDPRKDDHHHPHPPVFNCSCFTCYMNYWVRWDSSPNRHLIHQIIDAFEDGLALKKSTSKKDRKKRPNHKSSKRNELKQESLMLLDGAAAGDGGGGGGEEVNRAGDGEEGLEKGSVRKIGSFIGEKIWGVWG